MLAADLEPVAAVHGFAFSADQRLVNGTHRRIELELAELHDWRAVPELANLGDPGAYRTTFTLGPVETSRRYFLQFDRVCDRADIVLNGQALAPLLVPPWRCEVTGLLRAGENTLTITVTPTLRNQLVGYADAGSKDHRQYKGGVKMPSGLIGAVQVCALRE
ncbi:MAG: Glycosyl hydrolases family 2, sugar binding domain [Chloroflexi bacterium ADurb.Bin325]|nr:MAG: Glycosyl hydrolases family 2, sugar binding domain [Chloroflexi bacterium ADurb.Bin325]